MTFEVATVRVSAPLSQDQVVSAHAVGRLGAHLDGMRAQYTYMTLRALVVYAYKLRPDQVSSPDWMASERFDIVARLPEGSTNEDAPAMLKALLHDRFKLDTHMETSEHPVYALVVAKGGEKLKDSTARPAIDEDAELKPGEQKLDLPDGPARVSRALDAPKNLQGATRLDMGTRGVFVQGIDEQSQTVRIDGKGVTMGGFADMLTQFRSLYGDRQERSSWPMDRLCGVRQLDRSETAPFALAWRLRASSSHCLPYLEANYFAHERRSPHI